MSKKTAKNAPQAKKARTGDQMVRDLMAAKYDPVPDYTELFTLEEMNALIEAFVEQLCSEEARRELAGYDALEDSAHAFVHALSEGKVSMAPAEAADLLTEHDNQRTTLAWIREEIVFRCGIAIGLRQGGAR